PAIGPELLRAFVEIAHAALLGPRPKPERLDVEDAGPVHQQLVRAIAGDVRDDDALRILVRDRERVDVVARRGELDQRHRGDARPARAVGVLTLEPAPLDAGISGVDRENHCALAETTRPLRTARTPLRVTRRSAPSSARPPATPLTTRPLARRTRSRCPACASMASHSARSASRPPASKASSPASKAAAVFCRILFLGTSTKSS